MVVGGGEGGSSRTHFHHLTTVPRVEVEVFDCTVPINVYATPTVGAGGSSASGIMRYASSSSSSPSSDGMGGASAAATFGPEACEADFEMAHGFRRMSFQLS
jgi:hypothetical protein